MCANSIALDKYLNKQEKKELQYENLIKDIEPYREMIEEQIKEIKSICKSYDFDYDLELVEDVL